MRRGVVAAALCLAFAGPAGAEDEDAGEGAEPKLEDLSLEELLSLDLTVMSASKRAEDLTDTSAAVYALTGEEIRRIGALSIPEALRIVPGMHVGRADGSSWAVATRGFSGRFNTRMLVLVDGRTIYSPLFGGVFWEHQSTMLSDLDRIEVIRGPGGTLWGVNAVNGVINVISKSAQETPGMLATGGGGTEDRAFGSVRWGGRVGESLHYRVWTQYHDRAPQALENGDPANDPWRDTRGGLRVDWSPSPAQSLTLQAEAHQQRAESTYVHDLPDPPYLRSLDGPKDSESQYALLRFRQEIGARSAVQVQAFHDHQLQDGEASHETRDTSDVDVQLDVRLGRNALVVGAGYRSTADRWENRPDGEFLALDPLEARDDIFNVYAQDELTLGESVRVVVGSKFEHNDFTGFEIQPTARVNVRLGEDRNAWAAVSRAVKTPARLYRDGLAPAGIFFIPGTTDYFRIYVEGNEKLKSEQLIAVEGGYRAQLFGRIALDLAVFHNRYENIIQANQDPDNVRFEGTSVFVPFDNLDSGEVWGGEVSAKFSLHERLAVATAWSYQRSNLGRFSTTEERSAPRNMANVRLYMNVTERAEWNVAGYYYDVSGRYDPSLLRGNDLVVPPFWRLDMGVTLRPTKRLELAVWGQNLTDERHQEVKEGFVTPTTYIERGVYARLSTRFF